MACGTGLAACGATVAPAPAPVRQATSVAASAGRTWDAVIDVFAAENIPIRNMERASGFVSTDMLSVGRDTGKHYADCGSAIGVELPANHATYNVLVRGDSSSATVKATVRWIDATGGPYDRTIECSTRGYWERDFEAKVKAAAEGQRK